MNSLLNIFKIFSILLSFKDRNKPTKDERDSRKSTDSTRGKENHKRKMVTNDDSATITTAKRNFAPPNKIESYVEGMFDLF